MKKRKCNFLFLLGFLVLPIFTGCADSKDPTINDSFRNEIPSNDEYIIFVGSLWSNVTFPHEEHSQREADDCFVCHDHGATAGDSKWNCSTCHTANDPEFLCDQDANHGCIMAQCDFCHNQRGGAAPSIGCRGEDTDITCCVDCHISGLKALSGVLLDSAVEGLTYRTPTISGITDEDGRFWYQNGEQVSFSIGMLLLGQATGNPILTIVDLVDGTSDTSHPRVTNICRLLLTLDIDGDPDNGITLTDEIIATVEERQINFDQNPDGFGNDPDVLALIDDLNSTGALLGNTPRQLCPTQQARNHIDNTLHNINNKPLATFPGNVAVRGSNGCSAAACHPGQTSANGIYHVDDINFADGMLNGKPIYKNTASNHWVYWNTTNQTAAWYLAARTDRASAKHYYSYDRTGGDNNYPPLGAWPSGCATYEGQQIAATIVPMGGIDGLPWVGETLAGTYHYYDDDGDMENGTYFQWYRCEDSNNTNDVPITGAETESYTLTVEDESAYIRFGVTPGASEGKSPGDEILSGAIGPIITNHPPTAVNVAITGNAQVTASLTGSYEYRDDSGDSESGTVLNWFRSDIASGTAEQRIAAGTSADLLHYTLGNDDQGKYIRFSVTPGAATGTSPGLPAASAYIGPVLPDPENQEPSVSQPVIIGANRCICVNSLLSATYTYSDPENDPEASTFQWYRETAIGSNVYEPITGATTLTYTIDDDCEAGKSIKVAVTPGATVGNTPGAIRESAPVVVRKDPVNDAPSVAVSIQTPVYVGFNANITYAYKDAENNADRSDYQWIICDDAAGIACSAPVLTGTLSTSVIRPPQYIPAATDEGKYLKLAITPRAACGNTPGKTTETSLVQVLTNPDGNRPPAVSRVAINGDMQVGTALQGQYTYIDPDFPPDSDCSAYQWYRSANATGPFTAINGATALTFTPPDDGNYEGGYIQFGVTAIACTGQNNLNPQAVRSAAFGPLAITISNQPPTANPVIIGEEFSGSEIICVKSTAAGDSNYYDAEGAPSISTYAWYICDNPDGSGCGAAVSRSTTYTPETNDIGKYLLFEVTPIAEWGNNPGVTVVSAPKRIEFNPLDSPPSVTVYSGIQIEGLTEDTNSGQDAYINSDGINGVNGIYQIADTIRYALDVETGEYCSPKNCDFVYSATIPINGLVSGRVTYKHQDYYNDTANYWLVWYDTPPCRSAWWITDAVGRSGGGGAVAVGNIGAGSYTPPLTTWPEACGNNAQLSLFGGPNNKPGITGTPFAGNTLTGNYDYYDADGDAEGQSTFRWLRATTVNGSYTPIPGATGITYTLTNDDEGCFLKFEVRPVAVTGNSPGNAATSVYAGIGPIAFIPNVYIVTGAEGVNTAYNGSYHFIGYINQPSAANDKFAYWQKWNGTNYEGYYLYGNILTNELRYNLVAYRSGYVATVFPEPGQWCESYSYEGTCNGDTILLEEQE